MPISPIPFDYHSHNRRCGHAQGDMTDYIEVACASGMVEFGVSDHNPAYWQAEDHPLPFTLMAKSALPGYVAEAVALQERYAGRIVVRVGIEADYIEGHEAACRDLLNSHPFDYALGSVHWTRGRNIFDPERWKTEPAELVYREYYRLVAQAARSEMFDIMSHLTAVETFGPPIGALADELYPPVVQAVRESGCIAEVNTSGYRKMTQPDGTPGNEPFPNRAMLHLLVKAGVPLTFGSDSHQPADVGYGVDKVVALLKSLGIETAQPEAVPIRRKQGTLLAYRLR